MRNQRKDYSLRPLIDKNMKLITPKCIKQNQALKKSLIPQMNKTISQDQYVMNAIGTAHELNFQRESDKHKSAFKLKCMNSKVIDSIHIYRNLLVDVKKVLLILLG